MFRRLPFQTKNGVSHLKQNIAQVALSAATYAIDRPYSYRIPAELADRVCPGMRVLVPFGAGNRRTDGVVLRIVEQETDGRTNS